MITAIVTILITRLLLHLAGYPQVGGGRLHIAHALYGGALMMFALFTGWMFLGFGVRAVCVVLGGIGFGLFLDEVGKFVTKNNNYFYGPAAEIMYISLALLLVLARVVRDVRPPSVEENLANAAIIAAEGIARGLPPGRREWAVRMLDDAHAHEGDAATIAGIRTLLEHAHPASARLHAAQRHAIRLIPGFLKSRHVVPVLGWLMVAVSALSVAGGWLSGVLGVTWYRGDVGTFEVGGTSVATMILLASASITLVLSLPAMLAWRRTNRLWPLRWLRYAALIFTMLNALVDFATEGFESLINLAIGLFALAVISHQLNVQAAERAHDGATEPVSANAVGATAQRL